MAKLLRFFAPTTPSSAAGRSMRGSMIRGLDQVVGNFKSVCAGIEQDILPGVMKEALEPTLALSNYYAPIDTGEMRGSSYVEVRNRGGRTGGPTAEIGYGKGGAAPYTVFVHENPNFFHEPPTQYKFLQRAMDEDLAGIIGRIGSLTKTRMGL